MTHSAARAAARLPLVAIAFVLAACGGGDGGTAPVKPASLAAATTTVPTATVGTALTTAPTFIVKDASGNALGNVAVTVLVTGGGGTLTNAPTKTSSGATSVGTWTLGTTAGTNTITVTVSGLPAITVTATGTPGPATKLVVTSGNNQTAFAGANVASPIAIALQDQYGNGIPGQQITLTTTQGGGTIAPGVLTTDASGTASGATWKLGYKGGTQQGLAQGGGFSAPLNATIQSTFPLDLRFFGTPMSTEAQAAFTNAANRLRAAITLPISNVQLNNDLLQACGVSDLTGTVNEVSAGVIIYAAVANIDGPGKILAQAGPCLIRGSSKLPALGVMEFDSADIQSYIATGRFESVVLHEMNHVLGFGTVWDIKVPNMLLTPTYDANGNATGSNNPRFNGPAAMAQCSGLGGSLNHCTANGGVAVETCGGTGTADSHWREMFTTNCTGTSQSPVGGTAAFDIELMTGYAEGTGTAMPWSTMTLAQFQDLGYTVNLLAADTWSIPSLIALARMRSQQEEAVKAGLSELVRRPNFLVENGGKLTRIVREKK